MCLGLGHLSTQFLLDLFLISSNARTLNVAKVFYCLAILLLQRVEEEIVSSHAPVAESCMGAEQLIRERSKKLRPEQQESLQSKKSDLRTKYDRLSTEVRSKKQELEYTINRLTEEREQQVGRVDPRGTIRGINRANCMSANQRILVYRVKL